MVEWVDSASIPAGWTDPDDIDTEAEKCVTVGMFMSSNDFGVIMVLNRDLNNDEINGAIQIPWVAIKSIRKLVPE